MIAVLDSSTLLLIGLTAALGVASFSARRCLHAVRELGAELRPYGWKVLEDGPPIRTDVTDLLGSELEASSSGRLLLLYLSESCRECAGLVWALPALRQDLEGVRVIELRRKTPSKPASTATDEIIDDELVERLGFRVAPYAVYLDQGRVVRKGLVNTLEQARLLVNPDEVVHDYELR